MSGRRRREAEEEAGEGANGLTERDGREETDADADEEEEEEKEVLARSR